MFLVKLNHLLEGELANDVTVKNKEWLIILAKDVSGEGEGSSSAQGFLLMGEGDADAQSGSFNLKQLLLLVLAKQNCII